MARHRPSLRLVGFLLFVCVLSACGARPDYHGTVPKDVWLDPERDLELVRVWEQLEVVDALLRDDSLFLDLRLDGRLFLCQVNRTAESEINIQTDWLPVFFIEKISRERFDAKKIGDTGIPVFDEVQWQEISRRVVESFTPEQPLQGVVINSRDIAIFAYRNQDGSIVTEADRSEWATGVPLTNVLRLEKQSDALLEIIGGYLDDIGERSGQALFKTGELGPHARPLVIVDRSLGQVEFLSLEPCYFCIKTNIFGAKPR